MGTTSMKDLCFVPLNFILDTEIWISFHFGVLQTYYFSDFFPTTSTCKRTFLACRPHKNRLQTRFGLRAVVCQPWFRNYPVRVFFWSDRISQRNKTYFSGLSSVSSTPQSLATPLQWLGYQGITPLLQKIERGNSLIHRYYSFVSWAKTNLSR